MSPIFCIIRIILFLFIFMFLFIAMLYCYAKANATVKLLKQEKDSNVIKNLVVDAKFYFFGFLIILVSLIAMILSFKF